MDLLTRIAYSNGNPERTIQALRLMHQQFERETKQQPARAEADHGVQYLGGRLRKITLDTGSKSL